MKYGGRPDWPALNLAMEARDYRATKILIEYGIDINSRIREFREEIANEKSFTVGASKTALEIAIHEGHIDLIDYLLSKGADPKNHRNYGIYIPNSEKGWGSILIASCTTTAVYDAIALGQVAILKAFYENEIDLNSLCYKYRENNKSFTLEYSPIQAAIKLNRKECVEFLVSIGVDI